MPQPINDTYSCLTGKDIYAGMQPPATTRNLGGSTGTVAATSSGGAITKSSSGIPAWRSSMTKFTWKAVGGNTISSLDPGQNPAINPDYPSGNRFAANVGQRAVTSAYSGAAYHSGIDELWVFGGGHTDYAGNEIYKINMRAATPTWQLETWPSGAVGNKLHPTDTPNGTPIVLNDGQELSGKYADGRPRSMHSYNGLCFVGNDLWTQCVGAVYYNSYGSNAAARYNGATGTWTFPATTNTAGGTPSGGGIAYDQTRNRIWSVNNNDYSIQYIDLNDNTYKTYNWYCPTWRYKRVLCVDDAYLISLDNDPTTPGKLRIIDLSVTPTGANMPAVTYTGVTPPADDPATGCHGTRDTGVWVPGIGINGAANPTSGSVAVMSFDMKIYLITPPASGSWVTGTWTWSILNPAVGNTVTPATGSVTNDYGRLAYSYYLNALIWVGDTFSQVNVFALT